MSTGSPLLEVDLLCRNAPKTVAGLRRFRAIIETDGALPSKLKRLFLACAATTKGYEDMALRELAGARDAGLEEVHAAAAVTILSSARGEGAALRFYELFRRVYAQAAEPPPSGDDIEVAPGEVEGNFMKYFGTMPPSLGKLIALNPMGAEAYYLMREGTLSGTALEPAHAELLLVTVLAADYSNWASVHMNGARKAGASEEAVAEAVLCAVPTSGLSAWVVGATAMDAASP